MFNGFKRKTYINQLCQGISPVKPSKSQFLVQFYFEGGNAYCHSLKSVNDVKQFLKWAKLTVQDFELAYINYADGKNIVKHISL